MRRRSKVQKMGALRLVALVILAISFFTFVALFGRLPALRRTPISFLYRIIWIHIPDALIYLDSCLIGGRGLYWCRRSSRFLMHEKHPLVLIFFVSLLLISEFMFVPSAWQRLNGIHQICVPVAILLPFVFLYASVISKSFITPENRVDEMKRYPYDRVLFHPDKQCRTCLFPKPARSKHCSLCNACVARHDHHCIWLNNCVGHNNHRYFLGLLLSLSGLLIYGVYLGYSLLDHILQQAISPHGLYHWSKGRSWSLFFRLWAVVITEDIRVGAVFFLAIMTTPLALGFFFYHVYLIWTGSTTSETARWSDWKDYIADGLVFKAKASEIYGKLELGSCTSEPMSISRWPVKSDQVLVITDGQPPKVGRMSSNSNAIIQPGDEYATIDPRWTQVRSLKDVDNIYDLGFWNNLCDVLKLLGERR